MDTFLAYWAEDGDDSLDTFETEQEAVDCLEEWIERRRDDAADEGWPLGMRGYVARLTHRVQEYETRAPEGSSFESCCDYAVKSLPDAQAARIAALEGENAALRAQLAAPTRLPSVDEVSARVHEAWMESKCRAGVTSRKLEDGEELMVTFGDLSEQAKDLDRATVRAVYAAIGAAGETESAPLRLGRGPTVEEAKAHADAQEDGHGWWLVSFDVKRRPDDEAIYFEIASIEVEDGEVFVDGMSSADGSRYTEITDAIPLDASRQPCGVGVTQGQAMAEAFKDLAQRQTALGAEASAAITAQDLWDMHDTGEKETP